MPANKRTDEQVAQYFSLYFWLFWPTVVVENGGEDFPTFEDDGPKARVFALKIGGFFVVFVAKILRVVDLNLTTARILDRLDHLTLSEGGEGGKSEKGFGGFRDHAS